MKLDKTPPTISGTPDRAANAAGWYRGDVTVTFACDDALSGIVGCSDPATLGEGADQSATGTAHDAAGNAATTTVGPINVDKTAPTISGAPTTPPNGNGWYAGDVTIHWTCTDELSGVAGTCPADSVITGEGGALSTSASVLDVAGNSASATRRRHQDRPHRAGHDGRCAVGMAEGGRDRPLRAPPTTCRECRRLVTRSRAARHATARRSR